MFMVMLILVHASYSEYKEEVNDHSSEGCPRFLRNNTVWISREKKRYIETNDRVFRVCDDAGFCEDGKKRRLERSHARKNNNKSEGREGEDAVWVKLDA